MNTSIHIGNIVIHQSENGLYLLTDLWKASGKAKKDQPNTWINIDQTQRYIKFLTQKTGSENKSSFFLIINGGNRKIQGTYVCKELVYSYAMWISCEFHHLVVTTFDQVINASSTDDLKAAQEQAKWALGELEQMQARHPHHKQSLAAVLGQAMAKIHPFFAHLCSIGEIEKVYVPQAPRVIYRPTPTSKTVVGQKGTTLLFDESVKNLFPQQTDVVDFVENEGGAA